jgi:hypothetical protein
VNLLQNQFNRGQDLVAPALQNPRDYDMSGANADTICPQLKSPRGYGCSEAK